MNVYTIDPLDDPRWDELAARHPAASVFHSGSWLGALRCTYGYEPVAYTTSPPGEPLADGMVFCRVRSWLTGRRLVSLPFADHCDPLVDSSERWTALAGAVREAVGGGWRYAEWRPLRPGPWAAGTPGHASGPSYRLHALDLTPGPDAIFRRFHPSTIQRKIRRAEREGVVEQAGRSEPLLDAFYRLMLLTRRRHGIPPQSRQWFRNLVDGFGDRLTIRVAFVDGRPVGSILTLRHRQTLVYKYGCSDAAFHHLGVMPFLFWKAIQSAAAAGLTTFDLGRSDLDTPGLIAFKERLGGEPSSLTYVRIGATGPIGERRRIPAGLMARLPDSLLALTGRLVYPHVG